MNTIIPALFPMALRKSVLPPQLRPTLHPLELRWILDCRE